MRILLSLIVFFAVSLWPACAVEVNKVGLVDGEKVFDEYPQAQQASKRITDLQDELRDSITESEKIYTEFEKQKKSEAEKLTKQKELQSKIDLKAKDAKKTIESLSQRIEDDILQAIKTISAEKGLNVVFDKRAVLYGGVDITQPVIDHLKKKIPLANENNGKKENN